MRFVSSFRTIWFLLVLKAAAGGEPNSDASLSPGLSVRLRRSEQDLSQGQHKCPKLSKKETQENKTGRFCAHMWDGSLCWSETPAGTSVTQTCPDRPDLEATEKVTKYCDDSGIWVQRGPACQPALTDKSQEMNFLRAAADEPTTEAVQVRTEKKILENEKKCLEKMKNHPPYNKSGLYCRRNWDGWTCWDDTPAGHYASQNCPGYLGHFDPTEKATKYCGADGQWFRHPESNKSWTNYTLCLTSHDRTLGVMCFT